MNPNNNSLERTYFIGGAPRVGKSILAYSLAKRIGGHVVSTDSIRSAAKKACSNENSDMFIINKTENIPDVEWIETHLERPGEIVEIQNKESSAFWPSIVSFCNTFVEDDAMHIVEGVALLPSLVAEMKNKPKHIVYIGNTKSSHSQAMIRYTEEFPQQDWMVAMGYDREKIEALANFVTAMSSYFKTEAERYSIPYFEVDDDNFKESIESIIDSLTR